MQHHVRPLSPRSLFILLDFLLELLVISSLSQDPPNPILADDRQVQCCSSSVRTAFFFPSILSTPISNLPFFLKKKTLQSPTPTPFRVPRWRRKTAIVASSFVRRHVPTGTVQTVRRTRTCLPALTNARSSPVQLLEH